MKAGCFYLGLDASSLTDATPQSSMPLIFWLSTDIQIVQVSQKQTEFCISLHTPSVISCPPLHSQMVEIIATKLYEDNLKATAFVPSVALSGSCRQCLSSALSVWLIISVNDLATKRAFFSSDIISWIIEITY